MWFVEFSKGEWVDLAVGGLNVPDGFAASGPLKWRSGPGFLAYIFTAFFRRAVLCRNLFCSRYLEAKMALCTFMHKYAADVFG